MSNTTPLDYASPSSELPSIPIWWRALIQTGLVLLIIGAALQHFVMFWILGMPLLTGGIGAVFLSLAMMPQLQPASAMQRLLTVLLGPLLLTATAVVSPLPFLGNAGPELQLAPGYLAVPLAWFAVPTIIARWSAIAGGWPWRETRRLWLQMLLVFPLTAATAAVMAIWLPRSA